MPWNLKGFAAVFIVGMIVLTIGTALAAYTDSTILGIQHRLKQSDISQSERYALQGSLDWWNSEKVTFFQPLSNTATTLGLVVILFSIVYAVLSIWHESIHMRRLPILEERPRIPGQREDSSKSVSSLTSRKTGFPIAAGILTIIASSITVLTAIVVLVGAVQLFSYSYFQAGYIAGILSVSAWNVLAFGFGLTGGIFSLRRKHFALSVFGISLLLTAGFATILGIGLIAGNSWASGLLFGFPIIILTMLSLIFDSISKNEFT
jgi:hypothetical protein